MRGKLLIVFFGVALLPLAAATLIAVNRAQAAVRNTLGDARAFTADAVGTWLDRILFERAQQLQLLGDNTELVTAVMGMGDSTATRAVLAAAERAGMIRAVLLYDAAGTMIGASSDEEQAAAGATAVNATWFTAALAELSRPLISFEGDVL